MRKTQFAGLTVLNEDESILDDGASFIGQDRDTIDRLLQIGAKTHRHSGLPGLDNPTQVASGVVLASGGQIPADASFGLGYTLEDSDGGETELSPVTTVSAPPALDAPEEQVTAVADYTAGDLLTDTYYYAESFLDGEGGETPIGPATAVTRDPGYANARVLISNLDNDPSGDAVGWRLYRAVGGGDYFYLASGTGDTFTDDGSDSVNCDITPLDDDVNTTNGDNTLLVLLPSAGLGSAASINMYLSEDGTFSGDVLLDTYPIASAGQSALYRTIELLDQQPPDVNLSIGGANQIDPDTELIDWHWKRPVADEASLPVDADEGDVRVTTDTGSLWIYSSGAWTAFVGGGGGGGTSGITLREQADPGSLSNAHLEKTDIRTVKFASGNGISVIIADGQEEGEARVAFRLMAGSASGSIHQVQGSADPGGGGTVLQGYERLVFEASGAASVGVEQVPGQKWAKVMIGATGGGGGGGMGASALLDVTDEDGPVVSDIAQLQFRASGSATVGVNDLGGGVAEVVVWASAATGPKGDKGDQGDPGEEGPQGPPGAGGARHQAAGSAGVDQVYDDGYTEYRASGGLAVGISDLGGGASGAVTIAPLGRRWASASVNLASGASGVVDFTGSAAGGRLLKLSTSKRSRVRMYGDTASRTADAGRSLSAAYDSLTDGVLFDYQMAVASGAVKRLSPTVDAHNLEQPPANKQYLSVTNYDAAGDVVVAFLYIPTEVV